MAARKKAKKTKVVKKNYMILTSDCGSPSQAIFHSDATTLDAATKAAEKAAKESDPYNGDSPLYGAVYVVKIEKTGKRSNEVAWS